MCNLYTTETVNRLFVLFVLFESALSLSRDVSSAALRIFTTFHVFCALWMRGMRMCWCLQHTTTWSCTSNARNAWLASVCWFLFARPNAITLQLLFQIARQIFKGIIKTRLYAVPIRQMPRTQIHHVQFTLRSFQVQALFRERDKQIHP